jgi:hypothetical protein
MKRPGIARLRTFYNQLALRTLIPTGTPALDEPRKRRKAEEKPETRPCTCDVDEEPEDEYPTPKLEVELIPRSCWGENLRTKLGQEKWDEIRKAEYRRTNYTCEICGENGIDQGFRWPVECHEKWERDYSGFLFRLVGLLVLCPLCHKAKHLGRTRLMEDRGLQVRVHEHLMKVNEWTRRELELYLMDVGTENSLEGGRPWCVDMSWIDDYESPEPESVRRRHRGRRFQARARRRR